MFGPPQQRLADRVSPLAADLFRPAESITVARVQLFGGDPERGTRDGTVQSPRLCCSRDSVDDYLAFCKERGEAPEKPFSGQFVIRADSDLHRHLNAIAQVSGKSLNALVVEFLRRKAARALSLVGAATQVGATSPTPKRATRKARV